MRACNPAEGDASATGIHPQIQHFPHVAAVIVAWKTLHRLILMPDDAKFFRIHLHTMGAFGHAA